MDLIGPALEAVVDLAAAALNPTPSRIGVVAGDVAWDGVCPAGQVWSRLVLLEPAGDPTQPGLTRANLSPCGVILWRATIGVGVLRCAAVLDDAGNAPTAAVLTAEAAQQSYDMSALAQAVQCSVPAVRGLQRLSVIRWQPLGPDGGCVGGEWLVQALVDNCTCS